MKQKKNLKVSGYGIFKQTVAEVIANELEPITNKYNELMNNKGLLDEIYLNKETNYLNYFDNKVL